MSAENKWIAEFKEAFDSLEGFDTDEVIYQGYNKGVIRAVVADLFPKDLWVTAAFCGAYMGKATRIKNFKLAKRKFSIKTRTGTQEMSFEQICASVCTRSKPSTPETLTLPRIANAFAPWLFDAVDRMETRIFQKRVDCELEAMFQTLALNSVCLTERGFKEWLKFMTRFSTMIGSHGIQWNLVQAAQMNSEPVSLTLQRKYPWFAAKPLDSKPMSELIRLYVSHV